ncbi:hypothetical protein F7018_07370 [Tenacibaculum aiptasiae]|uniref:Knr4/Smi1-like domain-containing protein n=1 Tax=Tenacibaculum aiptasiae TaxID=426481 RepID=A0A7J5APH2_9FLAO|nr:SMI1/KNR4 family protein [Tenacibaculum aiptasiae]KAB1158916.1 hypothetical protein F7018_07370 [Tenacibaculum aiptasiae]
MKFIRDDKLISLNDLKDLEKLIESSLSKDYKQHMLSYNGGYMYSERSKVYSYEEEYVNFGRFFDLEKVKKMFNRKHDFLKNSFLTIGTVVGGYIAIGYNQNNFGEIHIYHSDGNPKKIANSFTEFIENLEEEDEYL